MSSSASDETVRGVKMQQIFLASIRTPIAATTRRLESQAVAGFEIQSFYLAQMRRIESLVADVENMIGRLALAASRSARRAEAGTVGDKREIRVAVSQMEIDLDAEAAAAARPCRLNFRASRSA